MNRNLRILRKVVLCALSRLALSPLKLLPIKQNRVLFTSYLEKQYSCNPRYISEELERGYGQKPELGWAFRNPREFEYLRARGIKVLDAKSFEFIKYALTARVIVTNTYYKPALPRRRGQYYIRTWHGGGAYKKVGADVKMAWPERLFIKMQQQGADLYLSSSKAFTELTIRSAFGYKGQVLECGMPRNDMLINGADNTEIRKHLGLKDGEKLVLYAPTYRADTQVHETQPDYASVTQALHERFGGTWRMGYRSHHVTMFKEQGRLTEGALDLTKYPDMQELLLASDALITDYSSSIWDYSFTDRPCFLYCPDIDKYKSERDFYTDFGTWPYDWFRDTDSLVRGIKEFSFESMRSRTALHHEELGSCETGRASSETAKIIGRVCHIEEIK